MQARWILGDIVIHTSHHETQTPIELPALLAAMRTHILSNPSEYRLDAQRLLGEVDGMLSTCAASESWFRRTPDSQWWMWQTDDVLGRPRWWTNPEDAVSRTIENSCFYPDLLHSLGSNSSFRSVK